MPFSTALLISASKTLFARFFLDDNDKFMIPTFCSIAYSIPAIILETVPRPSFPITRTDNTFAFSFWLMIAFSISLPWPLPSRELSISETLFKTFFVSVTPVSINAITFDISVTGDVEAASSDKAEIGFTDSVTIILLSSLGIVFDSSAVSITVSGSTATPIVL